MFLVSSISCFCPFHWNQVLCREWRCSLSIADAPTTSEWSTVLLPTKVRLISYVLRYILSLNHIRSFGINSLYHSLHRFITSIILPTVFNVVVPCHEGNTKLYLSVLLSGTILLRGGPQHGQSTASAPEEALCHSNNTGRRIVFTWFLFMVDQFVEGARQKHHIYVNSLTVSIQLNQFRLYIHIFFIKCPSFFICFTIWRDGFTFVKYISRFLIQFDTEIPQITNFGLVSQIFQLYQKTGSKLRWIYIV